tara:strand:- start:17 stop:979 length:963 start_codon:yes stop_codon:yes gene_type:complete
MLSLKDSNRGKDAVIIFGGPSSEHLIDKLAHLDKSRYVLFIEPKALTKKVADSDLPIDFLMLGHPEKIKDNTFQQFFLVSRKAGISIEPFIKKEFLGEINYLMNQSHNLYEKWNPSRGIFKNLKYKSDIYLEGSPLFFLRDHPEMQIITIKDSFKKEFPELKLINKFHYFKFDENEKNQLTDDLSNYLNVLETDDCVLIRKNKLTNAAAIYCFPLIKYMGINNIYLIGFDGSMLGNFEDNVDRYFKSRMHFYFFLILCRKAFSYGFKLDFPFYLRPKKDLIETDNLFAKLDFVYRIKGKQRDIARFDNLQEVDLKFLVGN